MQAQYTSQTTIKPLWRSGTGDRPFCCSWSRTARFRIAIWKESTVPISGAIRCSDRSQRGRVNRFLSGRWDSWSIQSTLRLLALRARSTRRRSGIRSSCTPGRWSWTASRRRKISGRSCAWWITLSAITI